MSNLFRDAAVIARRDFLSIVATPTFLLFLLAPLFMLGLGVVSGTGAASVATSSVGKMRLVAIVNLPDVERLRSVDKELRQLYRADELPPRLEFVAPKANSAAQADAIIEASESEVRAVLSGSLDAPRIRFVPPSDRHARYLAALAEGALASGPEVRADIAAVSAPLPSSSARQASGFGAVFGIFFLTLLLAGQSVGMLAEEKSNKVIEILAAAVRLESVFLGKLVGMFGVALVFVGFWALMALAAAQLLPSNPLISGFAPAVGLAPFLILCALYFTMAYMLLGAVFLGVGAQASSMREIQMLSLPITIFQVGMFGLSSAAAGSPGSRIATFAQWFPFSSPFAMAAKGATDPAIGPHLIALAWQGLWVGITIFVAARLFRFGVLRSGGGWRALLGLRPALDSGASSPGY